MVKESVCPVVVIFLIGVFNLATIRKQEDPIEKTRTQPIAFKAKMEEIKDGVKGAPSPSYTLYKRSAFLSDSPMKAGLEIAENEDIGKPPEITEVAQKEEGSEEDWWVDELDEEKDPTDEGSEKTSGAKTQ